jgi:transmembrane E3 ubiquitin-protein ligase
LVDALGVYDTAASSATFYSNVTGFINGEVIFHNITPTQLAGSPLPLPEWKSAAQRITADANMTELVDRLGVWNWSASDKVSFSLAEKSYEDAGVQKNIALVHVRRMSFGRATFLAEARASRAESN